MKDETLVKLFKPLERLMQIEHSSMVIEIKRQWDSCVGEESGLIEAQVIIDNHVKGVDPTVISWEHGSSVLGALGALSDKVDTVLGSFGVHRADFLKRLAREESANDNPDA